MRVIGFSFALIFLSPFALASGMMADPIGDQETLLLANSLAIVPLGRQCQDPVTDITSVSVTAEGTTATVRLTRAARDASVACGGFEMPSPRGRGIVVSAGSLEEATAIDLWWFEAPPEILMSPGWHYVNGGGGVVCVAPSEGGGCYTIDAKFEETGTELAWTFAVVGAGYPPLGIPAWDRRGEEVSLSAASGTSFPSGVFLQGVTIDTVVVRDGADPLVTDFTE